MSSDSELVPSPLPSPIFARCSPARGTVAKRCREFYIRRLERTAVMQKRWSICEGEESSASQSLNCEVRTGEDASSAVISDSDMAMDPSDGYPLRKCRSSLDLAMDSLRKEISSLIAQDNDLFRQLLSLHDSIAELRERQRHSFLCPDDDDDEDEDDIIDVEEEETGHDDHSLSLDSLSDPGDPPETSPESTLSSRSSLSGNSSDYKPHHHHHHRYVSHRNRHRIQDAKQRHRKSADQGGDSRPLIFVDKSEICFRCRKVAPPYRRSGSIGSLYYLQEDLESFDSGIHLQGSHSDSDHEIFV